jgi:hypothetical protein
MVKVDGQPYFQPDAIKQAACSKLTERIKAIDPGGNEVANLMADFADTCAKHRKPKYSDPVRTLDNWVSNRESNWLRLRQSRQGRPSSSPAKLTSADLWVPKEVEV